MGTEPGYGYRHILARHTSKYFINYDDKNENTLFEDEVRGEDIIMIKVGRRVKSDTEKPLEAKIDKLVYELYELTPDEIEIMENSVK